MKKMEIKPPAGGSIEIDGKEYLDPTPVEIPLNFRKPESLEEKMRRLIRVHMSENAQSQGFETFQEADDFEVDDIDAIEPFSPHEMTPDQEFYQAPDPDQVILDRKEQPNDVQSKGSDQNPGTGPEGQSPEAEKVASEVSTGVQAGPGKSEGGKGAI